MFQMNDMILELDDGAKVRTTADGYMAAMPRVARTGIQLYRGREVGRPDKDIVRIYRPEAEVFKKDSVSTFTGKPFTNDHPPVPVTSKNWKDYSVGITGEDILRDGEHVRVPMVLMDERAISDVRGGKSQLSVGYTCDIAWGEGTTPDGQVFDGQQKDITVNHIAIVRAARGGSALSIGDAAVVYDHALTIARAIRKGEVNDLDPLDGGADVCLLDKDYPVMKGGKVYSRALRDARTAAEKAGDESVLLVVDMLLSLFDQPGRTNKETPAMKTIVVDGITCEMSDTAVEVVRRALDAAAAENAELKRKAGETDAEYKARLKEMGDGLAKATTDVATLTAENATLKSQLKDAAITPEKIDAMVKDREVVATKAKAILPTVVVDGKSVEDIKSQVVTAKLGDAAKGWDASQIGVSFDTLTASITADTANAGLHATARAFSTPPANVIADSEKRYDSYDQKLSTAWKN
jgi:hypothetical protein